MFQSGNSIKENHVRFYIANIMLTLEHLHRQKILHRDIKPENIMLREDGYLVLVDMGTAIELKLENRFRTTTIIGTPHYMAPEIILGKGYSFSADYWSLGVLIYEFLCGKLPYGDNSA